MFSIKAFAISLFTLVKICFIPGSIIFILFYEADISSHKIFIIMYEQKQIELEVAIA